jgi:hypothetical protein
MERERTAVGDRRAPGRRARGAAGCGDRGGLRRAPACGRAARRRTATPPRRDRPAAAVRARRPSLRGVVARRKVQGRVGCGPGADPDRAWSRRDAGRPSCARRRRPLDVGRSRARVGARSGPRSLPCLGAAARGRRSRALGPGPRSRRRVLAPGRGARSRHRGRGAPARRPSAARLHDVAGHGPGRRHARPRDRRDAADRARRGAGRRGPVGSGGRPNAGATAGRRAR